MRLPLTVLRPGAGELPLDRAEVMRYLGYKPGVTRLEERHEALVDRGIGLALEVAVPVASLAYCGVSVAEDLVATRVPGLTWRSRSLARLLRGGVGVTLVAATVGAGVEELAGRLFREEEYALATVVDAVGSGLVHGLGRYVRSWLGGQVGAGVELTGLFGPGYGDWVVEDQGGVTVAAGGDAVGVVSTEACYLVPQKSLVGVIGWVSSASASASSGRRVASGCQLCTMPDCAYRESARESSGQSGHSGQAGGAGMGTPTPQDSANRR